MRKVSALFCTTVLLALLLIVPAQATLTTEQGAGEIDRFTAPQDEWTAAQNSLPSVQNELQGIPPGLTEADMYTGPIDSFTGAPLGAAEGDIGGDKIVINSTTGYDRTRHMFVMLRGSQEILSNVADGMTVSEPVSLIIPESMLCRLYRNGQPVDDVDPLNIDRVGAYSLSEAGGEQVEIMRFTIVNRVTGQLSRFTVPEGFRITGAMYNDATSTYETSYVPLEQEGKYAIEYCCPVTETRYSFSAEVDHTPPTLALPGVDEEGYAKGPVDISDLESGAAIGIWLNEQEIEYSDVLTQSGSYRIVLEDEAGNTNYYQFVIRVYFNMSGIIFLVAVLATAAGVGIYMLYSRRHLRVR